MSLWEYANPKKFSETAARILPVVAPLSALALLVGLVWGFFFTPDDYKQGATVKIIYLHVPSAMMAINAWGMMLVTSLVWLIRRHHVSALAARAAAPIGLRGWARLCWRGPLALVWTAGCFGIFLCFRAVDRLLGREAEAAFAPAMVALWARGALGRTGGRGCRARRARGPACVDGATGGRGRAGLPASNNPRAAFSQRRRPIIRDAPGTKVMGRRSRT